MWFIFKTITKNKLCLEDFEQAKQIDSIDFFFCTSLLLYFPCCCIKSCLLLLIFLEVDITGLCVHCEVYKHGAQAIIIYQNLIYICLSLGAQAIIWQHLIYISLSLGAQAMM